MRPQRRYRYSGGIVTALPEQCQEQGNPGSGLFWCACSHTPGSAGVSPAWEAARMAALPGMQNLCGENSLLPEWFFSWLPWRGRAPHARPDARHGACAWWLTIPNGEAELPGVFTQLEGYAQHRLMCVIMLTVGRCDLYGPSPPWREVEIDGTEAYQQRPIAGINGPAEYLSPLSPHSGGRQMAIMSRTSPATFAFRDR
jgi:hypothetical protein